MRQLKYVLRVFAGAAALTTFVGCEEVEPPRATVSTPAVAPTPPKPEVRVTAPPAPTPPVATKVAPLATDTLEKEGATVDALVAGARDAIGRGELDRALKLARLATRKGPRRSSAWNTLGRVQLKRGERKEAIASFERAVELNPSSSYAQNNLGLALIYDGRYDDAVDALEEATQLGPVEAYMWNNLGMAYEHLDRLDEARDAYQQAVAHKGERAQENLARLSGVKSIRTAKADSVQSDVTPSPSSSSSSSGVLPVDEVGVDGGVE